MGFPGDSAADLRRDLRAVVEGNSQTDSCGDWESDFPADSHRDSKADLRRDLQRDFRRDFDGDFGSVLRVTTEDSKPTRATVYGARFTVHLMSRRFISAIATCGTFLDTPSVLGARRPSQVRRSPLKVPRSCIIYAPRLVMPSSAHCAPVESPEPGLSGLR